MKQRIHISASMWNREQIHVACERSESEYYIPLATVEIELPDDTIPSQEVFESMAYHHRIECSEKNLNRMRSELLQAEGKHKELMAISVKAPV